MKYNPKVFDRKVEDEILCLLFSFKRPKVAQLIAGGIR